MLCQMLMIIKQYDWPIRGKNIPVQFNRQDLIQALFAFIPMTESYSDPNNSYSE